MRQFGFRHRILLLAVALVVATQLVMLFPVLNLIKRDSAAQTDRAVVIAGRLFDEYMHNRSEQLLTTVNVLVSDFPFKQAVANRGDLPLSWVTRGDKTIGDGSANPNLADGRGLDHLADLVGQEVGALYFAALAH